jgi:hypothetical protein
MKGPKTYTNFLSLAPNFISVNGGSNLNSENMLKGSKMVVRGNKSFISTR